jgi:homocitrate synthase
VEQLNLNMTDDQIKIVTTQIKQMGDVRPLGIEDVDSIIKAFHAKENEDETISGTKRQRVD